jgi:hypothetical protein
MDRKGGVMRTSILFVLLGALAWTGCAETTANAAKPHEKAACAEIVITGSLIPQEVCETPADVAARERRRADDQRELERIQRNGAMKR